MNKKMLFLSVIIVLIFAFLTALAVFKGEETTAQAISPENQHALERKNAPIKGYKKAKVTIVEFFDPACGTCSQFYPLLNDLVKKYPGKVRVMMRYAPLHEGSGDVVKMLEAAHMQGQFWPAVELLFGNQNRWVEHHVSNPQHALAGLKTLDLDHAKLEVDYQSAKVAKIIEQDIKDGQTLQIRATPEFFVNGKPLINFGYEQLVQLVDEAVTEAYK